MPSLGLGLGDACTAILALLVGSPAKDTTPGDDAGSQFPSCGCNIRGCGLGCSYFANIPRMEEISDRCS